MVFAAKGATAPAETAWSAWEKYMERRGHTNAVSTEQEKKYVDIGGVISKTAQNYQPKFVCANGSGAASFKLEHVDKVQLHELPKDLHDKLETIGVATLESALDVESLDYLNASFTTTDIAGALSVTGTIVDKNGEKSAVLVFVATETERQASWSRLEGLILHWACTGDNGGWNMPPEGWTAVPNKTKDAGGAWQCQFEKQNIGSGNEQVYVLVMQLPLRGVLKSGGLVFVLKGSANQADRWLKDANTQKDFTLDLKTLPVLKM